MGIILECPSRFTVVTRILKLGNRRQKRTQCQSPVVEKPGPAAAGLEDGRGPESQNAGGPQKQGKESVPWNFHGQATQ